MGSGAKQFLTEACWLGGCSTAGLDVKSIDNIDTAYRLWPSLRPLGSPPAQDADAYYGYGGYGLGYGGYSGYGYGKRSADADAYYGYGGYGLGYGGYGGYGYGKRSADADAYYGYGGY